MSVTTTADEKIDDATILTKKSLEALTSIIVENCWGSEDLTKDRKQELRHCFNLLMEVKETLEG